MCMLITGLHSSPQYLSQRHTDELIRPVKESKLDLDSYYHRLTQDFQMGNSSNLSFDEDYFFEVFQEMITAKTKPDFENQLEKIKHIMHTEELKADKLDLMVKGKHKIPSIFEALNRPGKSQKRLRKFSKIRKSINKNNKKHHLSRILEESEVKFDKKVPFQQKCR